MEADGPKHSKGSRLWIRLTLTFIVVAQVSIIIVLLLVGSNITSEFRKYIIHRERNVFGPLSGQLVSYYQQNGSWTGVSTILSSPIATSTDALSFRPDDGLSQPPLAAVRWQGIDEPRVGRVVDGQPTAEHAF